VRGDAMRHACLRVLPHLPVIIILFSWHSYFFRYTFGLGVPGGRPDLHQAKGLFNKAFQCVRPFVG
jgi:hypothetical protein